MRWLVLVPLVVAATACGSDPAPVAQKTAQKTTTVSHIRHRVAQPVHVAERTLGSLRAPVQDATSARWHRGAILAGGLTAADISTTASARATRAVSVLFVTSTMRARPSLSTWVNSLFLEATGHSIGRN